MTTSLRLGTFENTPETRDKIRNLQAGLKNTPLRVVLYGRVSGKRKLVQRLYDEDHPWCYTYGGSKGSVDYLNYRLSGRVPLQFAERIAVYLRSRPEYTATILTS